MKPPNSAYTRATEFFNKAFEELGLEEDAYANQDRDSHTRATPAYSKPSPQGHVEVNNNIYSVFLTHELRTNRTHVSAHTNSDITSAVTSVSFSTQYFEHDERFLYDVAIPFLKNVLSASL